MMKNPSPLGMLFLLALPLLASCSPTTPEDRVSSAQERLARSVYVQDGRTGLCFLYAGVAVTSESSDSLFTSVPCTPEVMAQVRRLK